MSDLKNKAVVSVGAMAETGLVMMRAATRSGATPQEALAVTRAYFEAIMSKGMDLRQQQSTWDGSAGHGESEKTENKPQ